MDEGKVGDSGVAFAPVPPRFDDRDASDAREEDRDVRRWKYDPLALVVPRLDAPAVRVARR